MTYRYIYKITCTTGKYNNHFYFGQHTTNNLNDGYKGSGKLINDYYKKYPNNYIKEIIAFYNTQEELNQAEYDIIHPWLGNEMCLNICEGGIGGPHPAWNKGIPCSEEEKQHLSKLFKGKRHSEETKQKISNSMKGKNTWMKDKNLSDEHKLHIAESMKGKNKWSKGRKLSEEQKQHISEGIRKYLENKRKESNYIK
jgi:hypothetical protein